MTMMRSLLLVCLTASLQVSGTWAQFPAIDPDEGFEVELEPFYVDFVENNGIHFTQYNESSPLAEDLQDYFNSEMRIDMPNLVGVVLYPYDGENSEFFTGVAIFRGPPFRTNHDVYLAQEATMQGYSTVNPSASSFMGIPEWFDPESMGDHSNPLPEEDPVTGNEDVANGDDNPMEGPYGDALGQLGSTTYYNYYASDMLETMLRIVLGAVAGSMLGSCAIAAMMYCLCFRRCSNGTRCPVSPKKVKRSNNRGADVFRDEEDDSEVPDVMVGKKKSPNPNRRMKEYHDEDEDDEEAPTKTLRRPSHHRRWNSHQVDSTFDFFDTDESEEQLPQHRRSSSAEMVNMPTRERTASMAELLAGFD